MSEKLEFYNLINDKTKVPRLTPIPKLNLNKMEYKESSALQKFRAQAKKLTKTRQSKVKAADNWKISFNLVTKSFYTEQLIKLAQTISRQSLHPQWEINIYNLIPEKSRRSHQKYLEALMKEVRQDYQDIIQYFNVKSIVNLRDEDCDVQIAKDYLPRAEFNENFYLNRKQFEENLFLNHRLIGIVFNKYYYNESSKIQMNSDKSLVNFGQYKMCEPLLISELVARIKYDLKQSCNKQLQCYKKTVQIIKRYENEPIKFTKNKRFKSDLEIIQDMKILEIEGKLPKILHCAEHFMIRQILKFIKNSIDNLIETVKDSGTCAQLRLQLVCRNDTLELDPSIDTIFAHHHGIIDDIMNVVQNFALLDKLSNEEPKFLSKINGGRTSLWRVRKLNPFAKIEVPEWFLEKAHRDLQEVLENSFKPLLEHFEFVCERFNVLCSSATKKQIRRLIGKKKNFEVYCSEVKKFNTYLADVNAMVGKMYYNFGVLDQTPASNDLKRCTTEIIDMLISELIDNHQELNRSICEAFENLENRALSIPDDTKSLFELTDYVSKASKVLVNELEKKIQKSVLMLSSLIDIALLSDEHIELNQTTINWLELIKPVFSQHNIFCEAKKGELEDELQRKINVLNADIDAIFPELAIINDMDDTTLVFDYRQFLAAILTKINQIDNQIESINIEEKLFKFPETTFPKVDEIKEVMRAFCSLIQVIYRWQKDHGVWMDGPFEYLDANVIEKKTSDYFDEITEMHKTYKVKIKSDLTSNKPFKFSGITDDPDPLQQPAPLKLCWQALRDLNEFKKYVSLAICMCNPALEKRHWDEMSSIAGRNLLPNAGTTLRKIINLDLLKDYEKYEVISISANKELALQQKLNDMIDEWKDMDFSISIDDVTELSVFTEENRIDTLLEEQFVKIAKMRASHFITPIETKVVEFYNKLCCIRDTIECWNCVQNQCENLNLFFSSETVQNHLENDVNLYASLEQILSSIEESFNKNPTFSHVTRNSNVLDKLKKGKYALEIMSSKMHDYLDQLRLHFTRLFFLSDDEVIQLLFVCQNLTHSKLHLRKCFPNIARVNMDQDLNILSIVGDSGEEVSLQKTISIIPSKNITDWLVNLKTEVTHVIKSKLSNSLQNFAYDLSIQSISQTPAMVIFCTWQIFWTTQVHKCFVETNLETLKAKIKIYKDNAQELLKLNLSRKDREIITSLIVLLIHHEEVVGLLIDKKTHDQNDFDWKAQVRYYYCAIDDDDEDENEKIVKVDIINTKINYAYEYYSSCQRISVNTPLTTRCYRNLMEAYNHNYFGALVGCSCVGKTETIMNLTRMLAAPFFMFSGEERLNYTYLCNIFKGLVSFEAWVFVKNFTRIPEEILSVVAQYIFRISQSKSMNASTINIEGTQLSFNPNCYLTFSINPTSSKLSSLPDNLKVHFRTVSFMNPDLKKICQVELFAAGFQDAENLAVLLVEVYKLCSEQLSCEKKYNLKLNNLKSIVETAAKLKFVYPDEDEKILLLRVLVDMNISQFVDEDITIFENILEQSFPRILLPPTNHDGLLEAVRSVCAAQQLSVHAAVELKVIQLYELIHLKQAIILVGEPHSGKSTILHILMESLLFMNEHDNQNSVKINCEVINPGALDIDRMYGFVDETSGKWNDGICSDVIRRFKENDEHQQQQNWLVFDSNMHVSWVEKLETVLDESKALFLTSNERVMLSNNTKIFFETENLENASPAMVSRCGIIYIDLQKLGWRPFLLTDIINVKCFQGYHQFIYKLFDWSIDPCLEFIQKHCTRNLVLSDIHLVMSTLDLFKMYMNCAIEEHAEKKEKDGKDHICIWSQAAIIMATIWTLTGNLERDSREKFEEFYSSLWNNLNENYPRPNEAKQFEISLPSEGKLYDNIYMFKGSGHWKHAGEILKTEKIREENLHFQDTFIPTAGTVKLTALLSLHVKYRRPFILIGDNSCGKTFFVQEFLANLPRSEYIANYFYFNSNVTTNESQKLILNKMNKIKQYNYGPSKNRYCINFVDDLNAVANKKGMGSTLELMRQHMDYSFWYDLKGTKKVNILDTMFAGMFSTGQDMANLCSRFLRHFNIFAMYGQSKDNMFRIFSNALLIDMKKNSFTADVQSSINCIVNATLDLYLATVQKLKATPSKMLYRFSLRDVQRITKGCSLIQKESVETKITFNRLWAHETHRVLGDRIVDLEDRQWFFVKMRETMRLCFKDTFESVFDHLPKYDNEITKDSFDDLAFGNLMDQDSSRRKYEEISKSESFKNKLLQYVKEYNETNKYKIDIVITQHAVQHLIRICRILATPGGSLLMISSSGSGRKSITRLAAFIEQQQLFEPIMNNDYDYSTWENDLKSIMMMCGTKKEDHSFFMTDRQMRPEFMRDLNNFLAHSEIPQLFSDEEQRTIIQEVRLDAQKGNRNLEINMSSIFSYFLQQCKQRLHFVLNISPFGDLLQKYVREYPFLLEHCTISWFDNWPEKALEQVASHYMKDINIQDSTKCQIILASKHFYSHIKDMSLQHYEDTGKMFYVMPSSFVRATKLYAATITKKQEEIKVTKKRYLGGLDKLQLAAREVAQMKNTLTKLRPQLEASARQTEATMKEIENENISVEKATVLVKRDEEIANKKAEVAGILKAECEAELAVAIPILEDALGALNTLKPTDITLVKAMKNPPDTVKLVMAAVCVMLSVSSERVVDPITGRKSMDYWGPSKRVLGDMNFLQNLKDYDKDNIAPTIIATIKKTYMSDKNFMPQIVAKASSAAEGLCKWVRAMVSYDEVAKVVAPKKEKLAAAQKECDETEAILIAKRKTLADLNMKLAALRATLEATLMKKLELEKEVENCTVKLKKAEGLIASLGGEKTRWLNSANELGKQYDNLPGDVLLSSATVMYLSSLSLIYRQRIILEWKEYMMNFSVPCSEDYDFVKFLGVETTINTWHLCGLSNNQFSLQNAIIKDTSPLWCLFVDPQTQANEWIKSMEKPNDLQVVTVTDTNYTDIIRKCMELGMPVLLENLSKQLDIFLDPFLRRDVYQVSETWYINLGHHVVQYNQNFRFYLTTRHHKPCYSSDVFNKVTVVDFLLPSDALRDRLLDIVIFRERPELQEKFEKILVENIDIKRTLKQQEDNILYTLSASTANILEDEGAIKTLDNSKSCAIDMIKRHAAAKKTKEDIDQFRETYSPYTKYCADLYSTLNLLPNLDHMYRFSLSWFTQLYIKSIETSNKSVVHRRRIDYLKMSSIQNLHHSVHSALFDRHKLIYSFILSVKTLLDTEQITEQEFNIFVSINEKRSSKSDEDIVPSNPASPWLSDESWREICRISTSLTVFQNLTQSFVTNNTKWRRNYTSVKSDCALPPPWDNRLTPFQKLILIRILWPDKIIAKVSEFVESVMGSTSNNASVCNIHRPYAESTCLRPLIFILPSYTSPFAIVSRFAKTSGYSAKLQSLSLGSSQEQKAERLIEMARKNGEWVFLHNCHLALPWMAKLEKICENFDVTNTSLGFRLWMTTQSSDEFPIGLLQNSIKIAFDSPQDVRQTMSWTYKSEPVKDREFFESCPGKDKAFSRLLYAFCLFHAVIRERRHFAAQSWNFQYDFDESDLHMSIIQLRNWVGQCEKVPYKALSYFLSECNYGGKIMNAQDKIFLDCLVTEYCNSKVVHDTNYDFDTSNAYKLPKRMELKDYQTQIKNIPNDTSPSDFFRDENVTLMKSSNRVRDFLNSLSCLNETAVIPDIEIKSNQVQSIIFQTLEKLPSEFDLDEVRLKYKVTKLEPLNYVLLEEIKYYNKYSSTIRYSLVELKRAYDGCIPWTLELENLADRIFQQQVPDSWKLDVSFCITKLPKFIVNLSERVKFINNWIIHGHPQYYWFGGLISCRRLLSTLKMSFARKKQVPMSQVAFEFNVLEKRSPNSSLDVPDNCIYVYGLYLIGAKWNDQTKSLSSSDTNSFYNEMPIVSFGLTLKNVTTSSLSSNSAIYYKCPLYVTSTLHNSPCNSETLQDNYILSVDLRTDVNPRTWTKRGTALYCQVE